MSFSSVWDQDNELYENRQSSKSVHQIKNKKSQMGIISMTGFSSREPAQLQHTNNIIIVTVYS